MLGGVHLRMENFQESWLMSQQAGVFGLCEKFHLYRLEKLVAISKFLDSYCARIMGGGQDNPDGWMGGWMDGDLTFFSTIFQ